MPRREEDSDLDAYDIRERESERASQALAPGGDYYANEQPDAQSDDKRVKKESQDDGVLVDVSEPDDTYSDDPDEGEDSADDGDEEEVDVSDVLGREDMHENSVTLQRNAYSREIEEHKQLQAGIESQERGLNESHRLVIANIAQLQENTQLALANDDSAAAANYMRMTSEHAQQKSSIEAAYAQLQTYKEQLNNNDPIFSNLTYQKEKEKFSRLVDYEELPEKSRARLEKAADLLSQVYDPRDKKFWKAFAQKARGMGLAPSGPQDQYHSDDSTYTNRTKVNNMSGKARGGPQIGARGNGRSAPLSNEALKLGSLREQALRQAGYEPGDAEWKRMAQSYKRWDKENAKQ